MSNPDVRERIAFGAMAIAVALRLASDWLFASGGPFPYQLAQAALLGFALILLWPRFETVFLKDRQHQLSVFEGLLALPLGLLLGLGTAWMSYGELKMPSPNLTALMIANNLFFPAVEELEFRGFLLGWLSRRKLPSLLAVILVAVLHMLAHPHYLWEGKYVNALSVFLMGSWLGSLTLRTRSLWGAYVAHALFNISYFLPLIGAGLAR